MLIKESMCIAYIKPSITNMFSKYVCVLTVIIYLLILSLRFSDISPVVQYIPFQNILLYLHICNHIGSNFPHTGIDGLAVHLADGGDETRDEREQCLQR
jgi:hypothetical protein